VAGDSKRSGLPKSGPPRDVEANRDGRLSGLARLFLKLGFVAFGGPAAHVAMMEDEVVVRRRWRGRTAFLDMLGATNLIPGPNSTEMVMHIGWRRAGVRGLIVSGLCFIGPAVLITGVAAWAYVRYGSLPEVGPFLVGIKPAVLAVILLALWRLGRTAAKTVPLATLGAGVAIVTLAGISEILALVGGGLLGALAARPWRHRGDTDPQPDPPARPDPPDQPAPPVPDSEKVPPAPKSAILLTPTLGASMMAASAPLWTLGLLFLKVGAVLYGSGYVLIAFLEGDLVQRLGWLTQVELLDAVAIGQFTPGPILSTATFVGYLVAGPAGALVATVGIFLPSFVFVSLLGPIVPRLRGSPWTAAFLDAVSASAVGLIAAVTVTLGMAALVDWRAWTITLVAIALGLIGRVNSAWLVLGGAGAGWLLGLLG
jgi:chromate transporter